MMVKDSRELLPLPWPYCPAARSKVLPQLSVGGRRVTCSCARVSPDFERRSSFVDAGWAEFWHRTGAARKGGPYREGRSHSATIPLDVRGRLALGSQSFG